MREQIIFPEFITLLGRNNIYIHATVPLYRLHCVYIVNSSAIEQNKWPVAKECLYPVSNSNIVSVLFVPGQVSKNQWNGTGRQTSSTTKQD
ncbi:hypothetical protein PR048_030388 [Dryococelus australis]|uniref:Uncharacterized protein n=1 Tax=Dryococelus australis TaxID=614101 RepID=A0ABQ9G9M3_9NEOP|nr:hypothetical protein PR048_030388 [Dryococelus australis]